MIDVYRKIFTLFDASEIRQFWLLTVIMVLVAVAEVVGMSSIFLLLNVLAEPKTIENSVALSYVYRTFGFSSLFHFQVALSVVVMCVVMGGLGIKALGSYTATLFSTMRGYSISSRLLGAYLSQPYSWFLERNSAEIGKTVLSEVDGVVNRVISPALRLVSNALQVIAVLGFLVFVDPLVTLFCGAFLGVRLRIDLSKIARASAPLRRGHDERFRTALSRGAGSDRRDQGRQDPWP